MGSKIIFYNKLPKNFLFQKNFKKIFSLILKNENITKTSIVNCVFLSKNKMLEYNKKYRNIEKISDVLSFTNDYKNQYKYSKKFDIGDIVFCHTKISQQAKEYNHTLKREYCYLFAHSLLHLFGYDHKTEDEANKMNGIVNKIMKKLNIER